MPYDVAHDPCKLQRPEYFAGFAGDITLTIMWQARRTFLASSTALTCTAFFEPVCAQTTGPMKPSQSAIAMRRFLNSRGLSVASLSTPQLIENALAFYRSVRAAGLADTPDADMLLFQWGVFDWGKGPSFELDLTRQFIGAGASGDDAISQLRCTAHFVPSLELRAIPVSNRWCGSVAAIEAYSGFIYDSAAFRAVASATPQSIAIEWGKV
jgi:hypothetical protein